MDQRASPDMFVQRVIALNMRRVVPVGKMPHSTARNLRAEVARCALGACRTAPVALNRSEARTLRRARACSEPFWSGCGWSGCASVHVIPGRPLPTAAVTTRAERMPGGSDTGVADSSPSDSSTMGDTSGNADASMDGSDGGLDAFSDSGGRRGWPCRTHRQRAEGAVHSRLVDHRVTSRPRRAPHRGHRADGDRKRWRIVQRHDPDGRTDHDRGARLLLRRAARSNEHGEPDPSRAVSTRPRERAPPTSTSSRT